MGHHICKGAGRSWFGAGLILWLCLGLAGYGAAEDAEVKLDSTDGSDQFILRDKNEAAVFGIKSDGNAYAVGYSSANKLYGDGSALDNVSTHTFKIGDSYGGGKIFWVDPKGRNPLIAAAEDQSTGIQWGNNTGYTGAQKEGLFAGRANTVIISTMQHAGSYAAQLCLDHSTLTAAGEYYDDWYLPSKEELYQLYTQKDVVGGFTNTWYWSSNEYVPGSSFAWGVDFSNGGMSSYGKAFSFYVRCVRGGPWLGNLPTHAETVTDGAYISSTQTFTGANTFNEIAMASVTITGQVRIARSSTTAADLGITLTAADLGKTITVNSPDNSARTVTLPSVTAADIGATITVVKLGEGSVIIQAAGNAYIADSTQNGAIYNNAAVPAYASLTLRLALADRWAPVAGQGAWITQ